MGRKASYFGETLSRPDRENAPETHKRPERGATATPRAATAERTLKWRPWGRRDGAKLRNKRWRGARQRHLPLLPRSHSAAAEPGTAGARLLCSSSPGLCRAPGSGAERKSEGLRVPSRLPGIKNKVWVNTNVPFINRLILPKS